MTRFHRKNGIISKAQMDQGEKAIQSAGRRLAMGIRKSDAQQGDGLDAVLPSAANKLLIKRSLTTESAAAFSQEITDDMIFAFR